MAWGPHLKTALVVAVILCNSNQTNAYRRCSSDGAQPYANQFLPECKVASSVRRRLISRHKTPTALGSRFRAEGGLREWQPSFSHGMWFNMMPVHFSEVSNDPSPMQIGFEDWVHFSGPDPKASYEKVIAGNNGFFAMCFYSSEAEQLLKIAVYSKCLETDYRAKDKFLVRSRVLGRLLIDTVTNQGENGYFIGNVTRIEDSVGLADPQNARGLVDEVMRLYDKCSDAEDAILQKLQVPLGPVMSREPRTRFEELMNHMLQEWDVQPANDFQSFAQLVAYACFDPHMIQSNRYDASMISNTEDRLRFVRDRLREKYKHLTTLKNYPPDKIHSAIQQAAESRVIK